MSSAAQKTPISLLQELCVQQGITADYKLMSVEGAVHAPTFMYRVQVGEIVATTATGASKKKAKHAAAKAALEKLLSETGNFAEGFVSDGVMINSATLPGVIASSSSGDPTDVQISEDVKGNPVGTLQELCMQRHWQPPYYETKDESGLPHERVFTIECQVDRFVEQGVGKSKRLAKRQAAQKMLDKLDSLKPKEETDANNQKYGEMISSEKFAKPKGYKTASVHSMYYERVHDFLNGLKSFQNPCLLALQDVDLLDEHLDCVKLLHSISNEQNFTVTYLPIDHHGKSGKYHCLVQINSLPVAVCFGIGDSKEEAKLNCARNALNFMQLMCRR